MEIRVHFTPSDLARTRLVPTLSPFFEAVYGACRLVNDYRDPYFTLWTQGSRSALGAGLRRTLAVLYSPVAQDSDLVAAHPHPVIEDALEGLRAMGRRSLSAAYDDLDERSATATAQPGSVGGDSARVAVVLAAAMERFYRSTLAPHWSTMTCQASRAHQYRTAVAAQQGIEGLLGALGPGVRWEYPILRYPIFASRDIRGEDVYLDGRGILLMPSVFLRRPAGLWITHTAPDATPVLSYPVDQDLRAVPWSTTAAAGEPDHRLTALLGSTRAALLRLLDTGCYSTSELAQRLAISAASASEHATVLRANGLAMRYRDGHRMRHSLTALGRELVTGVATT